MFALVSKVLLVAFAVLTAAAFAVGLAVRRHRPTHRLAQPLSCLATPWTVLAGMGVVTLIAAASQWASTHGLLGAAFTQIEGGWLRSPTGDLSEAAMHAAAIVEVQIWGAVVVATMVPLGWIAALLYRPHDPLSARVATLAAAVALGAPILIACAGAYDTATDLVAYSSVAAGVDPHEALDLRVASAWQGIEVWKWAISGVAACFLLACTPIVVRAAARGFVVSPRVYHGCQMLLLVGLAAWSTSRFATEDLERGPIGRLNVGQHVTLDSSRTLSLPGTEGLELPTGSECVAELPIDGTTPHLVLAIDKRGEPVPTPFEPWWEQQFDESSSQSDAVLVAIIDKRAASYTFEPYFVDAWNRGVRKVAVVTRRQHSERSLTLGEVRSHSLCVMAWSNPAATMKAPRSGLRWSTIAYHAAH